MARRVVPETANRSDWARLAATEINRMSLAVERLSPLLPLTDPASLGDYADDTAAAAGGVPVGGFYRTGQTIKFRET